MFRLVYTLVSYNCISNKLTKHASRIKYDFLSSARHKSYYHVLGLESTATANDIKSAYYKLSLKFHPDKNNGSKESVAKFREITEAYEVLSNTEKKRQYDQGYNFQINNNNRYTNRGKFYRSNYHGPFTGRTKDFNYDEHFRQHYQRQREVEYEYYRRRMEADFRRRYPNYEDYYRNWASNEEASSERYHERVLAKRHAYFVISAAWTLIFLIVIIQFYNDPNNRPFRHNPLYYDVSSENNESEKNK